MDFNVVVEACAKMLHAYAFANLADDDSTAGLLQGFNPGPGGDWCGTVPRMPAVALEAAKHVWDRVALVYGPYLSKMQATPRDLQNFGGDLALHVLGTGAGLLDRGWHDLPACPPFHYDEGYMYYFGGAGPEPGAVIWAQAAVSCDGLCRHVACWTLDKDGGLTPAKE